MVTKEEAVLMVEPRHLDQLLHPMFEDASGAAYKSSVVGKGLPASPGAAMGRIVFTADEAEKWKAEGEKVRRGWSWGWGVYLRPPVGRGCSSLTSSTPAVGLASAVPPCCSAHPALVGTALPCRSSWCALRPPPRTWAACTPQRVS